MYENIHASCILMGIILLSYKQIPLKRVTSNENRVNRYSDCYQLNVLDLIFYNNNNYDIILLDIYIIIMTMTLRIAQNSQ